MLETSNSSLINGDVTLEANKLKHLSPEANGRSNEGSLVDVNDWSIPDKINLVRLEPFGPLEKLPEREGDRCNEHHGVIREQTLDGELARQERRVAISADYADEEGEGYDCAPGLEVSGVWEGFAVKALGLASAVESQVGDTHGDIVDETTSGHNVDQPVQNSCGAVRQLQERQEGEDHDDEEAVYRDTVARALA